MIILTNKQTEILRLCLMGEDFTRLRWRGCEEKDIEFLLQHGCLVQQYIAWFFTTPLGWNAYHEGVIE
jgi:hypothetical protein